MIRTENGIVLSVKNLRVHFFTKRGIGKAVDNVSFYLQTGETLGLIGESGCGKTITALSILGLNPKPASRIVDGQIFFLGEDLLQKSPKELREYRGKNITMVLQEPLTTLNPVFSIADQIYEPLRLHHKMRGHNLRQRAINLLTLLRIPAPEERLKSYPHQFSGGMRQRVVSAIALSCEPKLLILDEPTTSLDVTVEAAYLALLRDIQNEKKLTILYITHDFSVVAKMCDRVAVMYAGKIVETAPTLELFNHPAHPYGEALLKAVPDLRLGATVLPSIEGYPPSIYDLPKGCLFKPRCQSAMPRCGELSPPEVEIAPGHNTSCWRYT